MLDLLSVAQMLLNDWQGLAHVSFELRVLCFSRLHLILLRVFLMVLYHGVDVRLVQKRPNLD